MTNLRALLLALFTVAAIAGACSGSAGQPSGSAGQPSPTPIGGTVDTPEEAVAAVIATEPRFTGITPKDAGLIGQSAWYEVTPASGVGAYLVQMQVGWGDCPAGCINRHTWTFAVLPDGTVNLQSEAGDPVPADVWPQPLGSGQTGVVGTATAGPICPVETIGDPACAPRPVVDATVIVRDSGGTEVARGKTGPDGAFFIALAAGEYTVSGEPVEGLMGTPEAVAVSVSDGSASQVQLSYDTGIR